MSEAEPIPPTSSVTALRIPMIKKGEYDLWSMKMRQYIAITDHILWDIITNGDQATTDPASSSLSAPKTSLAANARRNNEKALNILLSAIPDRHLLSFHDAKDARTLWSAIKARFGAQRCPLAVYTNSTNTQVSTVVGFKPHSGLLSLFHKLKLLPHSIGNPKKISKTNVSLTVDAPEVEELRKRNHTMFTFTDTECLIYLQSFKFVDEDLVILRAPRKNDLYSLYLKNIIPIGGIKLVWFKSNKDELSYGTEDWACNFKNITMASCKKIEERTVREPLELLHMDLFGPVSVESINKKKASRQYFKSTSSIAKSPLKPLADESWVEAMQKNFALNSSYKRYGCIAPVLPAIGKQSDTYLHLHLSWAFTVYQMDVKSAFLCNITEEVYVKQPPDHRLLLTGCSINYSLLVDPDLMGPWLQQFWATGYSQSDQDVPHIAPRYWQEDYEYRSKLRATYSLIDENGVDCFPKQSFGMSLRYIGYEVRSMFLNKQLEGVDRLMTFSNHQFPLLPIVTAMASGGRPSTNASSRAQVLQGEAQVLQLKSLAHSHVLFNKVLLPFQITANSQGTAEKQVLMTSKEVKRLPRGKLFSQSQTNSIKNLKESKKRRRKKHKKKVSSVKMGRNKDEGTLSEEHNVQEEDTAHPFFDDIADQDAAVTPDLERKKELDLETTQSTARQSTITPRTLNFEDEAGPSSPLRPIQVMDSEEQRNAAEVLVSISRPRGLSIPGPIQTQPQQRLKN
ncbi:hypothetical protein Tco_1133083 [Tanacetum coccineum]|uniref:Reverse transcriptase Ty1/copia-type domain-containing protein n=1 Tax=Tanacetum coccineum TaxID=301880 RepID=A0ABQ5JDQ7_9ASTR